MIKELDGAKKGLSPTGHDIRGERADEMKSRLLKRLIMWSTVVIGLLSPVTSVSAAKMPTPTEPTWTGYSTPVNLCACADAEVVVFNEDTIRMYYSILGGSQPIRSKLSTDGGVTWVDEPGDRLVQAVFADVVKVSANTYRMYFQSRTPGEEGIASAVSSDGLTWLREPGLRLQPGGETVDVKTIGGQSTAQLLDGTWLMAYGAGNGSPTGAGNSIYWATSKDGLSFVKQGLAVDGAPFAKFNVGVDGSELVRWDDGTIKLYFRGAEGIERVLFTGRGFTSQPVVLIPNGKPGAFPDVPGDPTIARYGGRWHLFHGSGPLMSPVNKAEGIYEAGYAAPKKTTITCMKGAKSRTVKAVSPVCPKGYALATKVICKKGRVKNVFTVVGLKCPKGYKIGN